MRKLRRFSFLLAMVSLGLTLGLRAQDEPSLGDVARETRHEKQRSREATPAATDPQNKVAQTTGAPSADTNNDARNEDGQNKNAQGKDAGANHTAAGDSAADPPASRKHVITNEDISSPLAGTSPVGATHASNPKSEPEGNAGGKVSAETWRTQIQAQKNAIGTLQAKITQLNDSIQFAPGNCVSGCVEWNERQKQKQDQVAAMKIELDELQHHLEEMQEAARQQGYGSSVYEP